MNGAGIPYPIDQFDRTIRGHPLPYDEQHVRAQFRIYIEAMPRDQRIRWELKNAWQRFSITAQGYRRARRDYLDALSSSIATQAWKDAKGSVMDALNIVRRERGSLVIELRWKRDRKLSPLGASLFDMMNELNHHLYGGSL